MNPNNVFLTYTWQLPTKWWRKGYWKLEDCWSDGGRAEDTLRAVFKKEMTGSVVRLSGGADPQSRITAYEKDGTPIWSLVERMVY